MKILILAVGIILSCNAFAVTTQAQAKAYITNDVSLAVTFLNVVFTKLNIKSCSELTTTRPDDLVDVLDSELRSGGNSTVYHVSLTYDSTDPDYTLAGTLYSGMDKRVVMKVDNEITRGGIIEFSCDMQKGRVVKTGVQNGTPDPDIVETSWDNTHGTPIVNLVILGDSMGPVFYYQGLGSTLYSDTSVENSIDLINRLTPFTTMFSVTPANFGFCSVGTDLTQAACVGNGHTWNTL